MPVDKSFVVKNLKKLKRDKACGHDKFPPGMLKDSASVIAAPLTQIINLSLESGTVPKDWKLAKVTPLFKSGSLIDMQNYRPISVLPTLSKILEKAVHSQLITYLEENHLLNRSQFGFRSKRSTDLAVAYLVDSIRKEVDCGKLTGAVYVDLSKAFDTVSHAVILERLPSYGIISNELQWFTDYLFERRQYVIFNGTQSDTEYVTCGVPQGSTLGPLLFLIHFNDVDKCLQHSKIIIYADDTVLFTSANDSL